MLTDRKARNIHPGDVLAGGVVGLTLRSASTKGAGKWVLRYVSPATHKRREMGMGSYPDVGVAEARKRAQEARESIANEHDPIGERRARQAVPTFEEAARKRYATVKDSFRNERHCQNWIRRLERYVFPLIGDRTVSDLDVGDFALMLRPIWLTKPETASRIKQRCQQVMDACMAEGSIAANPVRVVDKLLPAQPPITNHQPAMPWQRVPAFVFDHLRGTPLLGARACLLWAILTAARSNEARGARWSEIDTDAKLWTIPRDRMKARRQHRVPLSDAALELLAQQPRDDDRGLVFPSLTGRYLSDMALTSILRKAHAPSDVPGRTGTAHGFRSSFANWGADHKYASELVERALAHLIANQVQAAYERSDRLEARRDLMQQWGRYVMNGTAENIVPIGKRA